MSSTWLGGQQMDQEISRIARALQGTTVPTCCEAHVRQSAKQLYLSLSLPLVSQPASLPSHAREGLERQLLEHSVANHCMNRASHGLHPTKRCFGTLDQTDVKTSTSEVDPWPQQRPSNAWEWPRSENQERVLPNTLPPVHPQACFRCIYHDGKWESPLHC